MTKSERRNIGKIIVQSTFIIILVGVLSLPFLTGSMKVPNNPLSHKQVTPFDSFVQKTFELSETIEPPPLDFMDVIPEFVTTPEGGVSWGLFNSTEEEEYLYEDEEEYTYMGVRPIFGEELKNLEGTEILIQGYMFPLGQTEGQELFLLGPFPLSCPYHYHVPPKLIIEVHAKDAEKFSYDAVNVKGTLELVPKDDEFNVFYRLKDAKIVN